MDIKYIQKSQILRFQIGFSKPHVYLRCIKTSGRSHRLDSNKRKSDDVSTDILLRKKKNINPIFVNAKSYRQTCQMRINYDRVIFIDKKKYSTI